VTEIRAVYKTIKDILPGAKENISYVTLDDLEYKGKDILSILTANDFKNDLETYLGGLASSKITTLEEIMDFNLKHKEEELPPYSPNQKRMENALKTANSLNPQERQATIDWMRQAGGPNGIDKYLKKYDIDVIIGPADCECTEPPAAAGYPVATMPLSTLDFNGRPFGMSVVASAHQEKLLINVLSAWQATFPPRTIPPMLQRSV